MTNEECKVLKEIDNCKTCKKQKQKIKLQMSTMLPTNISDEICQYHVCKTCSKVMNAIQQIPKENDKLLISLYGCFHEEYLRTYYFTRLNKYPSYITVMNEILTPNLTASYTKELHKELKIAYENEHVHNLVLKTDKYEKPLSYYRIWHSYIKKYELEYIEKNKAKTNNLTIHKAVDYINDKIKILRYTSEQIRDHIIMMEKGKHTYYQMLYKEEEQTRLVRETNMPMKLHKEMGFLVYGVRLDQYEFNKLVSKYTSQKSERQKQIEAYSKINDFD